MGLFKFKSALVGAATMLAAQVLFADAVVDNTFEDNQNEFEFYWYYYDDNAGVGPNDRPQLFPALTPSVIDVPYTEKNRGGYDGTDATDTWQVKQYTFQVTEQLNKKCATMPFTFGAFAIASLSMIGAPPVAGFVTKWYLLMGSMEASQVGILLILLASTSVTSLY